MRYLSVRNRSILTELVRADFKVRYQGSVLGYAWSLLRPLFLFMVLYVIFVYIIPLGKGVPHFPVYLLTGVILWNFFAESTSQGIGSIVARGDLIRKINLPKYLLVVSSAILALINLLLSLIVLFIFALINGVTPSFEWLLAIPLILELFIFSVSISFLLSSLYVKFRDISYIWEVFLQIGFYASAIIFPLSSVAEGLRKWFFLNPVAQIIQDARYVLATNSSVTMWSTVGWVRSIIPFLIIIIFCIVGGLVFKRRSKTFAEDI
jgi:ABC-2 type transport system permease protein